MKKLPLVSVVVTTKNEEKNIGNCLRSIKRQAYPIKKIEIIVVDNSSVDKTVRIARRYTNKVFNYGPERSAQRNFGMMKKSKGKYLIFLDADMTLSPKVIKKAVDELEGGNLAALYVPEVILGNSFWSKVRRLERSFYDGTVIDCVRVVKRDIFKKVGGFDLSLTGPEDWDLDKKLRREGKVALLKNHQALIFHNEKEFSLKKYLAKKSYYSKSFDAYIKKWGRNDPDVKKQFSFSYRFFGVFWEKGKWKRLIRHPVLAMGIYLLRFLVGLNYLSCRLRKIT